MTKPTAEVVESTLACIQISSGVLFDYKSASALSEAILAGARKLWPFAEDETRSRGQWKIGARVRHKGSGWDVQGGVITGFNSEGSVQVEWAPNARTWEYVKDLELVEETTKFKAGDRVRVKWVGSGVRGGGVVTAMHTLEGNVQVKWDTGVRSWRPVGDLELVEEIPKFKIGDQVMGKGGSASRIKIGLIVGMVNNDIRVLWPDDYETCYETWESEGNLRIVEKTP
jgi:hypothetical protein